MLLVMSLWQKGAATRWTTTRCTTTNRNGVKKARAMGWVAWWCKGVRSLHVVLCRRCGGGSVVWCPPVVVCVGGWRGELAKVHNGKEAEHFHLPAAACLCGECEAAGRGGFSCSSRAKGVSSSPSPPLVGITTHPCLLPASNGFIQHQKMADTTSRKSKFGQAKEQQAVGFQIGSVG